MGYYVYTLQFYIDGFLMMNHWNSRFMITMKNRFVNHWSSRFMIIMENWSCWFMITM